MQPAREKFRVEELKSKNQSEDVMGHCEICGHWGPCREQRVPMGRRDIQVRRICVAMFREDCVKRVMAQYKADRAEARATQG